ncbi:MAG: hypothetical protein E7592_05960 [Ruminococcaceae bacterium]|nr:hypothetical protein [Oscillospiraceae bacterium]
MQTSFPHINIMEKSIFEDIERREKTDERQSKYSKYCDLVYYPSSVTPGIELAMMVYKPDKPTHIFVTTHGWHMSIPSHSVESVTGASSCLAVHVDMRGRALSDGKADCNGFEIYDVIDACEYVKKHYAEYISDPEVVYFEGGSGGGGNAYALAAKFPDYFAAITSMCGPSDYAVWYDNDPIGEFQDELSVWIGERGEKGAYNEAYASRSGIYGVKNLCSPMVIIHGETDERVPVYHARNYMKEVERQGKTDLVKYTELRGIGGFEHWQNATEADMQLIDRLSKENREKHQKPVEIARKGRMAVLGYLVTKHFSVFCESLDTVAEIIYDLDADTFEFIGDGKYTIIKKSARPI